MPPSQVKDIPGCSGCPMQRLFPENNFVLPQLPNPANDLVRLVIGEAPGQEESEQGRPFVGGSGRVLNSLLRSAGIPRDGLTITNCISCRPPGNLFPTDREARSYIGKEDAEKAVQQCLRNHVAPLLRSRNWKRVDLIGAKPLALVGRSNRSISTMRGSPISIPVGDKTIKGMAIFHPSFLMRSQDMLLVTANDLKKSLIEPSENYNCFPSIEDVRAFTATAFSFDVECPKYRTMGDNAPVELVGLCAEKGTAIVVPVRGEYVSELRRIFLNAKHLISFNGIQFDCPKLFKQLELEW